jgi:hypothetical protein
MFGTPIVPAPPPNLPTIKGRKMYGDPTTDFDHWDNPLVGTSRDPMKTFYDYYPKKEKQTSMLWLYLRESNWFYYGSAALAGILFAAIIFIVIMISVSAPHLTATAKLWIVLLLSIPTIPIVSIITLWFMNWYKKRPEKKKREREYRMEILIKNIDNVLDRYERICLNNISEATGLLTWAGVPVSEIEAPGFKLVLK